MNSNYELAKLQKLLKSGDENSKLSVFINLFTLMTFAALAIIFLMVSNSQLPLKAGLIAMAIFGFIAGGTFIFKQMLITVKFQKQFIDRDKVEKRISELKT